VQQALAAAGIPQLANVFYYGKEFGSKKQKVTKEGELEQEEYKALSVTKAGAEGEKIEEEALAQKGKTDENDVEELLKKIEGSSDNAATPEEIAEIIRQGA
jgi:alkylhydroperoxidase/carboxymuconolactone decarboxylase family protein YurZ